MFRTFRLTNEPGGLGLSCTQAGLALAGVPLLRRTSTGFVPRPTSEIEPLIRVAYGADPTRLRSSLGTIAAALNSGNLARATIAAVLTSTPELSREAAVRLAQAHARLAKYDEDEPRDWHGRWANEDAASSSSAPSAGETSDGQESESGLTHQPTADANPSPGPHSSDDDTTDDDSSNPNSLEGAFERKYDDLGPVEFSKEVIQFGDWVGREGANLSPDDRAQALAEYSFLQDRLSFWLGYDYTPPNAQLNLHSAALTLFQGGVNGGLVRPGDLPPSMLDVAGAAWGADNAPPNVRPATAKPDLELPPPAPENAPKEIEGNGGLINNSEIGIVWGKGNKEQGVPWEAYNDENLPGAEKLNDHSTGFDQFDASTGEATDSKTLDTLTVSLIKRPQQILSRLKGNINKLEEYQPIRASILIPSG